MASIVPNPIQLKGVKRINAMRMGVYSGTERYPRFWLFKSRELGMEVALVPSSSEYREAIVTRFANMRRTAIVLVIGITLMAAVVPFCQVVACHGMVGPMSSPLSATFAAECTAPVTGVLSSGILAENSLTTMLTLIATFVVALTLGVPPVATSDVRVSTRRTLPPLEHPRGVRLIA